ncbi:hypothetical protein HI914_00646 [Erysiphe necator]|nr:hypothetical protein HI914_00646 [Erysiphe necator]
MAKRSRKEFEDSSEDSSQLSFDNLNTSISEPKAAINIGQSPCKLIELDPNNLDLNTFAAAPVMYCSLLPHRHTLKFDSFEEYNVHYAKEHTNRCLVCFKNFPTDHLLSLHIEENHNSLFVIKKERGNKMYACFVEDCDRLCSSPQKRKMHMIDKHFFPKDYDFYVVNHGIGNRSSMLKSWNRRIGGSLDVSSAPDDKHKTQLRVEKTLTSATAMSNSQKSLEDQNMNDLASAMSSLRFIPPSVRFKHVRNLT